MTNRLLSVVVGPAFGAVLAGTLSLPAHADPNPADWVCAKPEQSTGLCKQRTIMESLPKTDDEVRHLVYKAKFRVLQDNANYVLSLEGGDWPAGFVALPPLHWVSGAGLLPDGLCKSPPQVPIHQGKSKPPAAAQVVAPPPYAYFMSEPIAIHLSKDFKYVVNHTLYIYPIDPGTYNGKSAYCMTFAPIEGGSHNGAVHADP